MAYLGSSRQTIEDVVAQRVERIFSHSVFPSGLLILAKRRTCHSGAKGSEPGLGSSARRCSPDLVPEQIETVLVSGPIGLIQEKPLLADDHSIDFGIVLAEAACRRAVDPGRVPAGRGDVFQASGRMF